MAAAVRRVVSVILPTLLVGVLLVLATLFWLVRHDGWLMQTVATGSMEPTVPTGSLIVSRPVAAQDIEVGDIIVFRSPTGATVSGGADGTFTATESMLITHRVVEVMGSGTGVTFRTRGDGNAEEDPWDVPADMVRARYVGHVQGLGTVLSYPGTRRWIFLGVAAVGCAVIVAETRSIFRELRARRGVGSDTAEADDPVTDLCDPATAQAAAGAARDA